MRNAASVNLSAGLSRFMQNPEVLPPTNLSTTLGRKKRLYERTGDGNVFVGYDSEPDVTQSEELRKPNNFIDLPDDSQLVRGRSNMADLEGQDGDMEFIAPFVCIMATAVANKFSLVSWSPDVVEYVLQCGQKLYKASKFRYDQVSRLDIPKVSLGSTDFNIVVEYLFDTFLKDTILELALDRILFLRSDRGIFVTPTYSCAVFRRHHLYYLYDGYGNNEVGLSEGKANTGAACLVRFKDLKSLVHRIIYNKTIREGAETVQYSRFVISKVTVTSLNPPRPEPIDSERGEDDEEWTDIGEDDEPDEEEENDEIDNEKETKPKVEVGWKFYRKIGTIRGSKSFKGRGVGKAKSNQITSLVSVPA
ncbi:hypothetical protein WA026_015867 [Henosepilachna vigintioctopunctata]|uniref:Uncharacterized protein n=1 Tax=Henosepilachna vigintioctopunctata TaxID=420089 RepID=A0AAW1UYW3_9CUCU